MVNAEYAKNLLANATRVGDCLECYLTPSQVYPVVKGYGSASRFVYEYFNGPISEGIMICHSCDNTRCIEQAHLFAGTALTNMQDKVAKGRQSHGGPGKYLSITYYREIVLHRYNDKTWEEIGDLFGVSRRTVQRLVGSCPHD